MIYIKSITILIQILISLSINELFVNTSFGNAFFPQINKPNEKELQSTSIQIGKTAIQLIKYGQTEEAIQLLELAVTLNPQEEALWINLAEAQIRNNQNKQAIFSIDKALSLNPKKENLYFTQASVYMNLNNPKNAIKIIKQGLLINNKSEKGYFQLGNAEIMLSNYNSALEAFKKSSEINPKFWQSINNQGLILYELNKPKKAISKFRLALKISNNAEPMLALAVALFSTENELKESISLAKNALKSNPKYVSTDFQATQLWGKKLQKTTKVLLKTKEMEKAVKEAEEHSQ